MITNLKLNNWRSHLDSEVKFSEGTNCFIGNMGTGKTSIMSGICFALFGTFPELKNKKLKLEDIIMKKPSKKEDASVELSFEIDGENWSVKRTIEKGRSIAELRKNGTVIEAPQPSKVTSEIERLLKIDYDLFTRAIYSEQNQLDMFLTIPRGQRMKKIDELLSIDKFESARLTTKALINRFSGSVNEKKNTLANLSSNHSLSRLEDYQMQLKNLLEIVEDLKKELSATKMNKIKKRKEIDNIRQHQEKTTEIHEKIKTTLALIESTEFDIDKIKEDLVEYAEETTPDLKSRLEKLISEASELKYTLGKERENLLIVGESNAKSEAKISMLENEKIPELKKLSVEYRLISRKIGSYTAKKVEPELKKNKKLFNNLNLELQKTITEISELEKGLGELEGVSSKCPVCDSKLTNHKKSSLKTKKKNQLVKMKLDIKKLETEIKSADANVRKLEKDVKDLEELRMRVKHIEKSEKELKNAEAELKKLQASLSTYLTQRKMQEKTIEMIQKSVDEKGLLQEKIKQLIIKRNEYDAKADKLNILKDTLKKLYAEKTLLSGFSSDIADRIEEDFKRILVYERELETRIASSGSVISEKENVIKELEIKNKMLNDIKKEIEHLEYLENKLKLLESGLSYTQEDLRKNFVESVNAAMQAIWNDIYPYNDFFGVRLGIEGGDYVLQLQDSTGWMATDGIASGGERSIACLALRIAFSLILVPQLRWMVLDEPTHNLDSNAVEELGNVLRDKVTNIVEQIFLITHDPALESAVSGYLYRLERDKGKDGYTKISKIN